MRNKFLPPEELDLEELEKIYSKQWWCFIAISNIVQESKNSVAVIILQKYFFQHKKL